LALGLFAACVSILNTGCIDKIAQNLLVGFGFTLGSLPAQYVYDQAIGIVTPDETP
jgi:hypothetical protein